ncbi:MAG: tetratricopeptide repeat protein [Sphingomonas sp.]
MRRGARRGLWLLAGGMALASPTGAQQRWQNTPPAERPYTPPRAAPPADSGADLRRNLTAVGSNPENISALVESGRAALRMGDPQAALTFFGRAGELAPRDARIRAGMGSAMVQLGQARPALTLFVEAVGLGAPEIEIASDRGLAHDLNGDPRAAQRDYALVLRRRDDPETRRRLALSLAISGQREPALRLLEPQIRLNDRAAWRTQAFVLALTGDAAGAARVAGTMMPGAGTAMSPFLGRLPALNPAQRAMAVHLGIFPSDGRAQYAANVDTSPDPGALALAGGPAPTRTAAVEATPARDARADRGRRTGAGSPIERAAVRPPRAEPAPRRTQTAAIGESRIRRVPGQDAVVLTTRRVTRPDPPAAAPPAPAAPLRRFQPPPEPAPEPEEDDRADDAAIEPIQPPPAEPAPAQSRIGADILAGVRPGDTVAGPGFSLTPQDSPPPATPVPPASEQRNSALSDIAMVVNALPRDVQGGAAPPPSPAPAAPPPPPRPAPAAAPPASPSRHWVQIAGNIERASMAGEFRRLRGRAPALLNGMQAWTTPASQTSRLLVGPFGNARDAQAFVNQLAGQNLSAFAWTSGAGQVIERLPTGR